MLRWGCNHIFNMHLTIWALLCHRLCGFVKYLLRSFVSVAHMQFLPHLPCVQTWVLWWNYALFWGQSPLKTLCHIELNPLTSYLAALGPIAEPPGRFCFFGKVDLWQLPTTFWLPRSRHIAGQQSKFFLSSCISPDPVWYWLYFCWYVVWCGRRIMTLEFILSIILWPCTLCLKMCLTHLLPSPLTVVTWLQAAVTFQNIPFPQLDNTI